MTNKDELIVDVVYEGKGSASINNKLDDCAKRHSGSFMSENKTGTYSSRSYVFKNKDACDEFLEDANVIISKHFPFTPAKMADLAEVLKLDPEDSIYHHVEFSSSKLANRFATLLRGVFRSFMLDEMWDIAVLAPDNGADGYIVIYGFPVQSVVSSPELMEMYMDAGDLEEMDEFFDGLEEDEEVEVELAPSKGRKKKTFLN